MSCLWHNSNNKEKEFNCQFCIVEYCESRGSEYIGTSISSTSSSKVNEEKNENIENWKNK